MSDETYILENGFRLHDCTVLPGRNIIDGPSGEQHLEPKVMSVLLVLASNAEEVVSREQLLEEVWPDTFSGDAALTRCVSLLRSSLGDRKGEHQFIETISKSGYRLVAPVVEFESEMPADSPPSQSLLKLSKIAVVGWLSVAIMIGILTNYYWLSAPDNSEVDKSAGLSNGHLQDSKEKHTIAVLPFANLSGDISNEYLSDGVSEEILNALAKISNLRVTSRSSSFSFKKKANQPLSEIADRLGVNSILEGSVKKFGDRIRVSVQLIEARGGVLLWSETYDREFDDVLVIQDEIARAVAATLKITLDIKETTAFDSLARSPLISMEAHEAFLRGRYLVAQRTSQSLNDAVAEFKKAISIQPSHAAALSELAITYLLLRRSSYGDLSDLEALQNARIYAVQAIKLDPNSAEAHAASGFIEWRKGNSKNAEQEFRRALEINPNYAIVYHWLSMLLNRNLGKHQEAFAASKLSRMLDPVSIPSSVNYMQLLTARGRHDEVAIELEKLQAISMTRYLRMRGELNSRNGQWANRILAQLDVLLIEPNLSSLRRRMPSQFIRLGIAEESSRFEPLSNPRLLLRLNRVDEAVLIARRRLQSDPNSVWAKRDMAMSLIHSGELPEARTLLEQLWLQSDKRLSLISTHFFTLFQGLSLYMVRLADGDVSGAKELVTAIDEELVRVHAAGATVTRGIASSDFGEGVSHYLSGNTKEGLTLIAKAVEDGYFIRLNAPYFKWLVEAPEFETILAVQEATQARELSKLLEIVCHDNPYKAVWQPSEMTCMKLTGFN